MSQNKSLVTIALGTAI